VACEGTRPSFVGFAVAGEQHQLCQARGAPPLHRHQPSAPDPGGAGKANWAWPLSRSIAISPWPRGSDVGGAGGGSRVGAAAVGHQAFAILTLRRQPFWWANWAWAGSCGRSASWSCVCRRPAAWAFAVPWCPAAVAWGKVRLNWGWNTGGRHCGGGLGAALGKIQRGGAPKKKKFQPPPPPPPPIRSRLKTSEV